MYGQTEIIAKKIEGLVVQHINEVEVPIMLPKAYSRDIIPSKKGQVPTPEKAQKWPHLDRINDQLLPLQDDMQLPKGAEATRSDPWKSLDRRFRLMVLQMKRMAIQLVTESSLAKLEILLDSTANSLSRHKQGRWSIPPRSKKDVRTRLFGAMDNQHSLKNTASF